MGIRGVIDREQRAPNEAHANSGFTIIEVLVSLVFVTVATLAMLQCLGAALQFYKLSGIQWEKSLTKWNQAQQLRAQPGDGGGSVLILPGTRPLYRFVVPSDGEGDSPSWEVLRAAR